MLFSPACTATMHPDPQPRRANRLPCAGQPPEFHPRKRKSPGFRGFQLLSQLFCFKRRKPGTRPALTLSGDSIHPPGFGDLGTGRPGIPLFNPDPHRPCVGSCRFGALDTGRSGVPSLRRARRPCDRPAPFGNLGTGRPGIPSFIALASGSPAASGHRPRWRPSRPAAAGPPPRSAAGRRRSGAFASSRPCR